MAYEGTDHWEGELKIPNAYLEYADRLTGIARDVVKHLLKDSARAEMLEQIATELRDVNDDRTLLTEGQAVRYTRGYNAEYLRRTIRNYGTAKEPLYRKGELPRKPLIVNEEQRAKGRRGTVVNFDR